MISGFNTDIEFQGIVYHVQTEDKGDPARVIMSLVYNRGTILASKRTSYDELSIDFSEAELAERLSRQHKLICAAVKSGRIDELVKMTANAAANAKIKGVRRPPTVDLPISQKPLASPPPISGGEPFLPRPPLNISMVETEHVFQVVPLDDFGDELVIDAVHIIEEEEVELIPAEAVAVVSELSGRERSVNSKLSLELLSETKFKGGDRSTVTIMICRGTARKVVAEAQVMIKVLGSSFRPVIFHAKTDVNGIARVHLQLPHFDAGRAALLIRAIADGEEIELRRIVTPG